MKSITLLLTLAAVATVAANPTKHAIATIKASGNAFWAGDKRFYIRGIDYQPGGDSARIDPLADKDMCTRDIKYFKDLGVNTIRVYTVDNSKDHKECMSALADAGIYLVLDVNTGGQNGYSLNRAAPALSYNAAYLQNVFATIEEFAQYDNTLAFFSGNEVINEAGNEFNAPYIKAVTRDMRAYITARKLRAIPVGYSAADVAENRLETAKYLNCGSDDVRSDFFAFNDYSFCNTDFKTSGWDQKVKNFTNYGIPIFLSEYGCIKNRPRKFDEIEALMSSDMTGVYSGGMMYEYSYEKNKFGIVKLSGENGKGDVEKLGEYDNLKSSLTKYTSPTGDGGAARENKGVDCPAKTSSWNVDPILLPIMPREAAKFMKDGAGKGPGLTGKGSQTAGDSGLSPGNSTGSSSSGGNRGTSDKDNSAAVTRPFIVASAASILGTVFGIILLWQG
ncbi:hypothetical protein NLG97_g3019 [Lecanicillium saksenae]|uniref:Uncharacterized protein n=1 Tax=Lecanicillium saksenae TaxID=468837 RepID=A0ACC1QZW8_9HYPO|nr:hypothetical protein NLG97_g3019 [Lecanicillium saksenae]